MVFQYQNLTLKIANEMEHLNPKPLILLLRVRGFYETLKQTQKLFHYCLLLLMKMCIFNKLSSWLSRCINPFPNDLYIQNTYNLI